MRKLFALIFIFSYSVCLAQEPRLSAHTDSSEYLIGEWILLRVEGEYPRTVESITPAVADSIGPFELMKVTASEPQSQAEYIKREWTFQLINFDSGKVFVPPIEFRYRVQGDTTQRTASTNPVHLTIAGVTVDPKGDIRDIKPPVNAPWKWEDIWPYALALLILLLAGAAYYYYRKKQKAKEEAFVPLELKIPPHELALMALRDLEDKKLWQQGKIKEYYSEVTEIIRRFFEGRFGIIALELTSDEILDQLKRFPEMEPFRRDLLQFFTTADLVKFAKYDPTPEEHEKELKWAYEIVRGLAPPVKELSDETMEEAVDVR